MLAACLPRRPWPEVSLGSPAPSLPAWAWCACLPQAAGCWRPAACRGLLRVWALGWRHWGWGQGQELALERAGAPGPTQACEVFRGQLIWGGAWAVLSPRPPPGVLGPTCSCLEVPWAGHSVAESLHWCVWGCGGVTGQGHQHLCEHVSLAHPLPWAGETLPSGQLPGAGVSLLPSLSSQLSGPQGLEVGVPHTVVLQAQASSALPWFPWYREASLGQALQFWALCPRAPGEHLPGEAVRCVSAAVPPQGVALAPAALGASWSSAMAWDCAGHSPRCTSSAERPAGVWHSEIGGWHS